MRGVRRKTAEHLAQAWITIPHVTQHDKADITELEQLRARFAPKAEKAGEPGNKAHFEDVIRQEVSTYDDYITGRVYGYVVLDQDEDVLDSCWGFFGDLDYVRKEARESAEHVRDKGHVDGGCTATCESGV